MPANHAIRLISGACVAMSLSNPASARVIRDFWAVTGIAEGGSLPMLEYAMGGKVIASIPSNTGGLPSISCHSAESPSRPKSNWCRVEYEGVSGWVDARFLKPDPLPRQPIYAPAIKPGQKSYRGFGPEPRKLTIADAEKIPPCLRVSDSEAIVLKCAFPEK